MDELAQLRVENSELQRQLQAANDRCAAAEARQQADAEALKLLKKAASESREKEAAAVKAEEGRLKAEQHVAAGWEARAGEYSRKIGELEQKLALARQGSADLTMASATKTGSPQQPASEQGSPSHPGPAKQ
ncbi:hypothetical protein COHA_003277 [Chlorella ohadii]|uniref:Uncharacterized protein n=1 Tax=Chlorella ohadii TaxID=2649997 RepID=A0AAD5DVM7_9CHLO|nr:hypothetical protein COHA_003277 [Chlorella ohadii]